MKKFNILFVIFTTVILLGLSGRSSAQYNQWNFGFEGGVGIRSTSGTDALNLDTKPTFGYIGGLFAQYNINSSYAIKLGVNYQRKGSEIGINTPSDSLGEISLSGHDNYGMITVPLLFRGMWGTGGVKFFANVGPYVGFVLTHRVDIDEASTYYDTTGSKEIDLTDSTTTAEFGISMGIGMQFPLSPSMGLTVEIRDDLGITNLSDFTSSYATMDAKTNSANLIVGLSFGAGKKYVKKRATY